MSAEVCSCVYCGVCAKYMRSVQEKAPGLKNQLVYVKTVAVECPGCGKPILENRFYVAEGWGFHSPQCVELFEMNKSKN